MKLWLLNLVGNAALLACVYFWLLMPDAHGWQVGVSAVVASSSSSSSVAAGRDVRLLPVGEFRDHATVGARFARVAAHGRAAVWAVLMAAMELLLFRLRKFAPQFACGSGRSRVLPALRRPAQVFHAADWLLWFLIWVLCLRCGCLSDHGCGRRIRIEADDALPARLAASRVLAVFGALMLIGVYVRKAGLVDTRPQQSKQQAWSMGFRFLLAYVILISAWVPCCWSSVRGWRKKTLSRFRLVKLQLQRFPELDSPARS